MEPRSDRGEGKKLVGPEIAAGPPEFGDVDAEIPPLKTSLGFVIGSVLREWKMSRSTFDLLPMGEQEDMIAHYLATQKIQRWQNFRDWKKYQNGPQPGRK